MCMTALISAGIGLLGARSGARAADRATAAQTSAANQQLGLQREVYGDQSRRFQPFLDAGTNALGQYQQGIGGGPQYEAFDYQSSPGYNFIREQGMNAIDGTAAASGGLFSGATLEAQTQYATGLASQDYNNQFNNYQVEYGNRRNEYTDRMNRLGGLADMGSGAAGMQATAGNNYAAGAGAAFGNIGNAQSAGAIGRGNAINSGIGNALSAYGYMQTMPGGGGGINVGRPGSLFGGNSWG